MTTIIRRKRTSRSEIGPYKRHESLTGKIVYPVQGYSGYGDGSGIDLAAFISDEMRTTTAIFPDSKLWLFAYGDPDTLPWAARVLDK
jgi:hypothetical protein